MKNGTSEDVLYIDNTGEWTGSWVHVAMTYAPNNFKFYLNGVLLKIDTSINMTAASSPMTLMRDSYGATNYTLGNIAEFCFENTATPWTLAQIEDLMHRSEYPESSNFYTLDNTNLDQNGENGMMLHGLATYNTDTVRGVRLASGIREIVSKTPWSGLGMCFFSSGVQATDILLLKEIKTAGITKIRIDIPDYSNSSWMENSKRCVLDAIALGFDVVWGVSSSGTVITADNWSSAGGFKASILTAAQWAQDNGVYEFQLGNEEELHNDDDTMPDGDLRVAIKATATEVQAIFTRGNISYSFDTGNAVAWGDLGRGDIDLMAMNTYHGNAGNYTNWWSDTLAYAVWKFGAENFYLSEWGLSSTSIVDYSPDEDIQAIGVANMLETIKASGISRAFFFCYNQDPNTYVYTVKSGVGSYRLLWNPLTTNNGRWWFTN